MLQPIRNESCVRRARAEDVAAIAALEIRSQRYPWTESQIRGALANAVWVIEVPSHTCVGWLSMRVVLDEAEILNVAVDPAQRRHGLGRQLLREALTELAEAGVNVFFLEVRASNTPAQALYQELGFVPCGRRQDYYRDGDRREDALLMRRG